MIKVDYELEEIKEYKEKVIKQDIYKNENIKMYKVCPHCGCSHFIKYGKYKGIQRYQCKNRNCRKTFSNTTRSVWKNLKHKPEKWMQFIELMCEERTLKQCSLILKITVTTAFHWRHKILHAVENYYKPEIFKESVTVTDYYIPKCYKGSRNKNYTENQKKENKINRMFGFVPNDVSILVAAENDEFPNISVKSDVKDLQETFENDVLSKADKECYVHLYNFYGDKVEKPTIEYNKKLPKDIQSKFGFKVKNNWIGIPHIKDSFQVSGTMKNYTAKVSSWMYRFRGIATKYLQHYHSFFSLINSVNTLGGMDIFWQLLKNSNYISVKQFRKTHVENY